jgi:hypothetical protein
VFTLGFPWIVGFVSIFSIYWTFSKLFSKSHGQIGALIYAASYSISQTEREVVPTTPVFLWCIWFFYFINKLFKGDKSALIYLSILWALIWHLNLALALLSPLLLIAIVIQYKKYRPKDFIFPTIVFLLLSLPLLFFELRHNFLQVRGLIASISGSNTTIQLDFFAKFSRSLFVVGLNATRIFFGTNWNLPVYIVPGILLFSLFRIPKYLALSILAWFTFLILFFSFNSINLSEYYVNSLNIIWVFSAAHLLVISHRYIVAISMIMFVVTNVYFLSSSLANGNGYLQKKALINTIYQDAKLNKYPCVSLSYITDPGYNFGFRYFTWLVGLKTHSISSRVPVYTIVFPHSRVDRLDDTFGSLGLILPNRSSYLEEAVTDSCNSPDFNLSDTMFGFVK